jgi:mRNA-degrading endonuclease RelE of RelBE toxin-antitoxin system
MYRIKWNRRAQEQFARLSSVKDQQRIVAAVTSLGNFPDVKQITALVNHQYGYRLRVGNYRILFDVESVINIIEIQEVKKRDDHTY